MLTNFDAKILGEIDYLQAEIFRSRADLAAELKPDKEKVKQLKVKLELSELELWFTWYFRRPTWWLSLSTSTDGVF